MRTMDAKTLGRLITLHGVMLGSDQIGERENARDAIKRILEDHGYTWSDLIPLMSGASHVGEVGTDTVDAPPWIHVAEPAGGPADEILERVLAVLRDHVQLGPLEVIAIALWAMHTFVFDKFTVTPRLLLESPVRGCGKTTVLVLLEALGRHSLRFDGVSPAGLVQEPDGNRTRLSKLGKSRVCYGVMALAAVQGLSPKACALGPAHVLHAPWQGAPRAGHGRRRRVHPSL